MDFSPEVMYNGKKRWKSRMDAKDSPRGQPSSENAQKPCEFSVFEHVRSHVAHVGSPSAAFGNMQSLENFAFSGLSFLL